MEEAIIEEQLKSKAEGVPEAQFKDKMGTVQTESSDEIYQIFDKVFKKIITLSSKAVVNLINGLFGTDYPLDSTITYNWTEFVDDNMKRVLADTIITINGKHSYHLEAQMEKDNSIVFRVFEYGFGHASRNRIQESGRWVMRFPKPMIIYLYYEGKVPDEYSLILEFDEGSDSYEYKVPVLKLPEVSSKELSDRQMIILVPFHVLKLRYALKQGSYFPELPKLILDDIIANINENVQLGNITLEDSLKLKRCCMGVSNYLSKNHEKLEWLRDITDESLMTDNDILRKEHEDAIDDMRKEHEKEIQEKNRQLAEMKKQLEQLQANKM